LSHEGLLDLDPDLLHVIAFGPGFGESVLVRVPPGEWLVVDSLRQRAGTDEQVPAATILDRYQATAAAVVLTHPHLDHSDGIPQILDRRKPQSPVGCLAAHFEPPEKWRGSPDSEQELAGSATEAALQRIFDIWEREPESKWDLTTNETRAVGEGQVQVVHPPAGRGLKLARGSDPNRASSPLLIEWEHASLLLGADLPSVEWKRVPKAFRSHGALSSTSALKIAHHGSKKAQYELAIGRPPPTSRACVCTPWTKGARLLRLPRFEDGEGVDILLQALESILLTSMPTPYEMSNGQTLTRSAAERSRQQRRIGDELIMDVEPPPPPVADAWVHLAVGPDGNVLERSLGPAAIVLQGH